jgi:hypothetical protein
VASQAQYRPVLSLVIEKVMMALIFGILFLLARAD